jgi:hypothetical protein
MLLCGAAARLLLNMLLCGAATTQPLYTVRAATPGLGMPCIVWPSGGVKTML